MSSTPLELAHDVLARVHGDEARVRVTRTRHGLTRFANSFVHQHVGEDTVTVELLLVRAGRTVQLSGTRTDADGLARLVTRAQEAVDQAPVDPTWPGLPPDGPAPDRPEPDDDPDATPDARAAVVADFVAAGEGMNAAGYCETVEESVALAMTSGRVRTGRSTRATLDGIHRTDTSAGSGHRTGRALLELDGASVGRRAADIARRGIDPGDVDPGEYEVVLCPEPVATLCDFLSIYGFNAKGVAEGRSAVTLGTATFDRAVTLTSDPTDPRSVDLPFDHEGTDTRRVPLVEAGNVVGLAHDRRTADAAGATSTGHHHGMSTAYGPIATSLVLAPGETTRAELIAGMDRGVLVTAFNYCRVLDPKTLVVTGLTRNGTFLVEDGRIVRPLGNLRFTQSFTEALAPGRVTGVGVDARHAEGEFGPGTAIVPSLRLSSWRFTGNQRG